MLRVLIFKELCRDSCSQGSGPVSTKHCDLGNIDTEGERDRGMEGQRDRGTEGCVCVWRPIPTRYNPASGCGRQEGNCEPNLSPRKDAGAVWDIVQCWNFRTINGGLGTE